MNQIITILITVSILSSEILAENSAYGYHSKLGITKARYLNDVDSQRIVGGTPAALGEYAFQAGILITLTTGWPSVCSGSLISSTRVLTAAHCWFDGINQAAIFTVVLGSLTLFSGGTRVDTRDVVTHPSWRPEDVTFDVAMVRIDAVQFNNNIYPVPLPDISDASEDFAGWTGTASGFGKVSDAINITPLSATLYRVDAPIITNSECQQSISQVHGSHLCTSGEAGRGTCDGDAGGPLTVLLRNQRTLVGIASFDVIPLCQRGQPSVFSRVTAFLPWILANM